MPSRSRSPSSDSSSSSSEDEHSHRRRRPTPEPSIKEEPSSPRNGNGGDRRREPYRRDDRRRDYDRSPRRRYDNRRGYDRDRRRDDSRDRDRGRDDRRRDERNRDYREADRRDDRRERPSDRSKNNKEDATTAAPAAPKPVSTATRTGGVYIPPFKLAQMQKNLQDKSGAEYQRMTWDALKKSINGLINKVNVSNIKNIIPEVFAENIIRGRGLFCRSLMRAQAASTNFTHVYAALVAVVNTKFPQIGELLLNRLVDQFRKAFNRNIKPICLASTKFIAHLLNQKVCGEVLGLQLLMLLLEKPTDDSVEVAVSFVREAGKTLQELHPQGFNLIFERFRSILHEGSTDERVQFLIEALFADRKKEFKDYPSVLEELDLVDEEDQITHEVSLDDTLEIEEKLNYFTVDPDYQVNDMKYQLLKKEILGSDDEGSDGDDESGDSSEDESEDEGEQQQQGEKQQIIDDTETELVNLRRTIYLTIMSSLDFEDCGHKLMKLKGIEGKENEICNMLVECCSQERTYLRFYGLLAQRFCMINPVYLHNFEQAFVQQYSTIHRLETNKLRNVAKFFAHLLHTDALPWNVLYYIRLNEQETTSSSRIFIKILFQEMAEYLGLLKLNERLRDPEMAEAFSGIMPKDNPRNTRFAINFFTSIGLGGLTEDLREHLRNAPKQIMQAPIVPKKEESSDSSDSSSDSDSDSSSSDSDSSSSDSDSDSDSSDSDSDSSSSSDSDSPPRKRSRR